MGHMPPKEHNPRPANPFYATGTFPDVVTAHQKTIDALASRKENKKEVGEERRETKFLHKQNNKEIQSAQTSHDEVCIEVCLIGQSYWVEPKCSRKPERRRFNDNWFVQ